MVTFVPTPIGNLQDITFRAIEAFSNAELFLCEDTRVTKQLINLIDQKITPCSVEADFLSFNEHNGLERLAQVGSKLSSLNTVFVSDAGMPSISDPGVVLVEYCQKHNIKYSVLAGASALTTAYSASGFESGRFTFWGFLPHKGAKRSEELNTILAKEEDTILYESPHRLLKLLQEISSKSPQRVLFLAKELTKKYQRYYRDSAKNLYGLLKDETIRGEWVVIVKGEKKETLSLGVDDIKQMDIPPKIKAKLLAKITNTSVKEWYNRLIN